MQQHKLVGGTLTIEDDPRGDNKGVVARCECGWHPGYRFSSFAASNAFSDHLEEVARDAS